MIYSFEEIQNRLVQLDFSVEKDETFFVGIRTMSDKKLNHFDDWFYVLSLIKNAAYPMTTQPGTYWLQNFINPQFGGTAVLKSNECYIYKIGQHRGYKAFVQATPVKIYRDSDKDLNPEEMGNYQEGYFAINIHRAAQGAISKLVDKWSAGCQVLASDFDFQCVLTVAEKSGQNEFKYFLLREW